MELNHYMPRLLCCKISSCNCKSFLLHKSIYTPYQKDIQSDNSFSLGKTMTFERYVKMFDDSMDIAIGSTGGIKFVGGKTADKALTKKLIQDVTQGAERKIIKDVERGIVNNTNKIKWVEPNIPIGKQLEGKGQLRDLTKNKNLNGVDIYSLLKKTPAELEEMSKNGQISKRTLTQIKKTIQVNW